MFWKLSSVQFDRRNIYFFKSQIILILIINLVFDKLLILNDLEMSSLTISDMSYSLLGPKIINKNHRNQSLNQI